MRIRRWEVVGQLVVDTARVVLIDPTNVEDVDPDAVVDDVADVQGEHAVLGVVVATGYGDGLYPVEIRRRRGRVAAVRVRFL